MKRLFQDLLMVWMTFTACLIGGLILNEFRPAPLPWIYHSADVRMEETVEALGDQKASSKVALEGDVTRDEMEPISSHKLALILDARPDVFYRLSHIPNAISLPRDDFENRYKTLKDQLEGHKTKPVVVYCAELDCHDSQMVGDALTKLGFQHVRLYRLGWSDWQTSGFPQESSQ